MRLRVEMRAEEADMAKRVLTLEAVRPAVQRIVEPWGCEVLPSMEMLFPPFDGRPGLLVLPEVIFRMAGILVSTDESSALVLEREEDATTWEDFLLMKLAHTLAFELNAELFYEEHPVPLLVEPERFETFEHYVDKVLEQDDELVKEMKRVWIYTHRKRAVR